MPYDNWSVDCPPYPRSVRNAFAQGKNASRPLSWWTLMRLIARWRSLKRKKWKWRQFNWLRRNNCALLSLNSNNSKNKSVSFARKNKKCSTRNFSTWKSWNAWNFLSKQLTWSNSFRSRFVLTTLSQCPLIFWVDWILSFLELPQLLSTILEVPKWFPNILRCRVFFSFYKILLISSS